MRKNSKGGDIYGNENKMQANAHNEKAWAKKRFCEIAQTVYAQAASEV